MSGKKKAIIGTCEARKLPVRGSIEACGKPARHVVGKRVLCTRHAEVARRRTQEGAAA